MNFPTPNRITAIPQHPSVSPADDASAPSTEFSHETIKLPAMLPRSRLLPMSVSQIPRYPRIARASETACSSKSQTGAVDVLQEDFPRSPRFSESGTGKDLHEAIKNLDFSSIRQITRGGIKEDVVHEYPSLPLSYRTPTHRFSESVALPTTRSETSSSPLRYSSKMRVSEPGCGKYARYIMPQLTPEINVENSINEALTSLAKTNREAELEKPRTPSSPSPTQNTSDISTKASHKNSTSQPRLPSLEQRLQSKLLPTPLRPQVPLPRTPQTFPLLKQKRVARQSQTSNLPKKDGTKRALPTSCCQATIAAKSAIHGKGSKIVKVDPTSVLFANRNKIPKMEKEMDSKVTVKRSPGLRVTKADVLFLKSYFDELDEDQSGTVDLGEIDKQIQRANKQDPKTSPSTVAKVGLEAMGAPLLKSLQNACKDGGELTFQDMLKIVFPMASNPELGAMASMAIQQVSLPPPEVSPKVSKQEEIDVDEMWSLWDKSGRGELDCEDFKDALRDLGVDQSDVRELYDQVDVDGSGLISLSEFKEWYFELGETEKKSQYYTRQDIADRANADFYTSGHE